jgi:4-hydroxy-tetrahydrodipicolinate synthase
MKELGRLITAMVTPFDKKGEVDYDQARKLALALLKSGSEGLVLAGTTGESPTLLHEEEEITLFKEVKKAVGKKGSIIANTGSNSTAEAVLSTKDAEKLGVDACLLVVPYYNKPSQEGLYQHFKTIAENTDLPCILYNVPSRTITSLSAETTIRLSKIPNIIGTKEASGNMDQISKIIKESRPGFLVWSGNDGDTLPMLALGAHGVISVTSHLAGKQMSDMIYSYVKGDTKKAAEINAQLLPLFTALFLVSNPQPVKYALNKIGFSVGKPRLPLVEPDAATAALIDAALKKCKIDLPVK